MKLDALFQHPDALPDPMACIIHIAAWRARAESNSLDADEIAATFPADVAAKIGVTQALVCEDMPPLPALVEGLDQLISQGLK